MIITQTDPQVRVRRPTFRYYGSKARMAPWILSFFRSHRVYVEPFGGGGFPLLAKPPVEIDVYNDLDGEVVNAFRVVRNRPEELKYLLAFTPFAKAELELVYEPTESLSELERARRFFVRAYQGRGGGRGKMRTGWRRMTDPDSCATRPVDEWQDIHTLIDATCARLRSVQIEQDDALNIIHRYDAPHTLFYCDPPYLPETRGRWANHGYAYEMTIEQHAALASALQRIQGMAAISHYPHPLYEQWYTAQGWHKETLSTLTDGGFERTECLWLSPILGDRYKQGSLFENKGVPL